MKKLLLLTAINIFIISSVFAQMISQKTQSGNVYTMLEPTYVYNNNNIKSLVRNYSGDIVYTENIGQITDSKGNLRSDILFHTRSQGVDMYITNTGISYVFRKTESESYDIEGLKKHHSNQTKTILERIDMNFIGMNKDIEIKKELATDQKINYFTGENPDGISPKSYRKISIKNIYDGIDLVYYEKEGKMKYDFVVKAGADPGKIKMMHKGEKDISIDKDGNILVTTSMGEIKEEKPYTYSKTTGSKIESSYKLKGNVIYFDISNYNINEEIVIDPYRIWATYYGGNDDDQAIAICTDNDNLYVTGFTESANFPLQTLAGAYNDPTCSGGNNNSDIFILKFNSQGERIWATYYGGNSQEWGRSICTDNENNVYVTGQTYSADFPTQVLAGAYNDLTSGGGNAFILKFSNTGERLWATYYGGSTGSHDKGNSICTDSENNLYVTGYTGTHNFPTQILEGAYNQSSLTPSGDAFILKFNSIGERLWATYYGGNSGEAGYRVCTDNMDNLYVTGYTGSSDFPMQALEGAYNQDTLGGNDNNNDHFILKFNNIGERLWATYYGGSNSEGWIDDEGYGICTDDYDNLYITGFTRSDDFPVQSLAGAYNQTYNGGYNSSDAFILKFNNNCERLWATYYGGSDNEYGCGICTDNSGNIYLTGTTNSDDFPIQTSPGSYNDDDFSTACDAFILKFNNNCERQWATYYGEGGSSYYVQPYDITVDNSGDNLFIAGESISGGLPLQALTGAYNQTSFGGGLRDGFLLKFSLVPVGVFSLEEENILLKNYPNPFNQSTTIGFTLEETSDVELIIYNMHGQKVRTLVNKKEIAGNHQIIWDGKDEMNSNVAPGIYYCRIKVGDKHSTLKMQMTITY